MVDVNLTCRTCLMNSLDLLPIFTTKMNGLVTIQNMLTSFCNLELAIGDGFAAQICGDCSLETLRAYNFKLKCEESDVLLRSQAAVCETEENTEKCPSLKKLPDEKLENSIPPSEIKFEVVLEDGGSLFADGFIKDEQFSHSDGGDVDFEPKKLKKLTKKMKKSTAKRKHKKIKKKELKTCVVINDIQKIVKKNKYKKIYECPKCNAIFQTFRMISKHLRKLHETAIDTETQLESFVCGLRRSDLETGPESKAEEEAAFHLDSNASSLFSCTVCSFTSANFKVIKQHIISHKGEKYICCDECDYRCSVVAKLMKHKVVHCERAHACAHCPYRASTRSILRTHAATQHSEARPYHCDRCLFTCKLKMK